MQKFVRFGKNSCDKRDWRLDLRPDLDPIDTVTVDCHNIVTLWTFLNRDVALDLIQDTNLSSDTFFIGSFLAGLI